MVGGIAAASAGAVAAAGAIGGEAAATTMGATIGVVGNATGTVVGTGLAAKGTYDIATADTKDEAKAGGTEMAIGVPMLIGSASTAKSVLNDARAAGLTAVNPEEVSTVSAMVENVKTAGNLVNRYILRPGDNGGFLDLGLIFGRKSRVEQFDDITTKASEVGKLLKSEGARFLKELDDRHFIDDKKFKIDRIMAKLSETPIVADTSLRTQKGITTYMGKPYAGSAYFSAKSKNATYINLRFYKNGKQIGGDISKFDNFPLNETGYNYFNKKTGASIHASFGKNGHARYVSKIGSKIQKRVYVSEYPDMDAMNQDLTELEKMIGKLDKRLKK